MRVTGLGFLSGATLAIGGVAARVTGINGSIITAIIPSAAGEADVVVTNPNGTSAVLARGFTFNVNVISVNVSSTHVSPGEPLTVSWIAPGRRSTFDWVGLFKVGVLSTSYEDGWWEYTNGTPSGAFTLRAPAIPGEYEFRYLLDDGFVDVARTGTITVR